MSYTPEQIAELKAKKPNLWRIAEEIASYGDSAVPVLTGLTAMLAYKAPVQPENTDNNQKFNDLLNNCKYPLAMYSTLLALAPLIKELRNEKRND